VWRKTESGVIDMPEGFELTTESVGLRVRVIDYHARDVVIPWEMIERLKELRPTPEELAPDELADVIDISSSGGDLPPE